MTKFKREDKADRDLEQCKFGADGGVMANPAKYAVLIEQQVDPFKNVTCPFCLSFSSLRKFLISSKKGVDRRRGRCPVCGLGMRLQTLSVSMASPEAYAVFAFKYPAGAFWERVKTAGFDDWKKHLRMMNWTGRFWDEYKKQRGDTEDGKEREKAEDDYEAFAALATQASEPSSSEHVS